MKQLTFSFASELEITATEKQNVKVSHRTSSITSYVCNEADLDWDEEGLYGDIIDFEFTTNANIWKH